MKKELIEILYNQILFFTENGKSYLEHPNFMVQEVHKSSGQSRIEVTELFVELIKIGFIGKVEKEKYAYEIKQWMEIDQIQRELEIRKNLFNK